MGTLSLAVGQAATWTPTVPLSDASTGTPSDYTVSFTNSAPTLLQVTFDIVSTSLAKTATLYGLKAGTATLVWTITPSGSITGGVKTITDTITVTAARSIGTATGAYSTPAN